MQRSLTHVALVLGIAIAFAMSAQAQPPTPAPSPAAGHQHGQHGPDHFAHRFDNADELAKRFDDPARDAW